MELNLLATKSSPQPHVISGVDGTINPHDPLMADPYPLVLAYRIKAAVVCLMPHRILQSHPVQMSTTLFLSEAARSASIALAYAVRRFSDRRRA